MGLRDEMREILAQDARDIIAEQNRIDDIFPVPAAHVYIIGSLNAEQTAGDHEFRGGCCMSGNLGGCSSIFKASALEAADLNDLPMPHRTRTTGSHGSTIGSGPTTGGGTCCAPSVL